MSHDRPVVFVVDDDVSVRESLSLLIEAIGWHAEAFGSAQQFLEVSPAIRPSCLVLDVHLPDLNGLDVQTLIADRTYIPIIFISGHSDVPVTVRAMRAGAVEFLTKPLNDDLLIAALQYAIHRSATELQRATQVRTLRNSYASLSRREQEVMGLIVAGRLNKQVGGALGISEITVKAHRGKMMRKMKAANLPELVRMADRLSL